MTNEETLSLHQAITAITGETDPDVCGVIFEAITDGNDYDAALKRLENGAYEGTYEDEEEYATCLVEDTGMLDGAPDIASTYFDYEAYGRDLRLGGDISVWRVPNQDKVVILNNHV